VASLSQGRTAAAQCGLFTHKSVPVIFEPPCNTTYMKGAEVLSLQYTHSLKATAILYYLMQRFPKGGTQSDDAAEMGG